MKQATKSLVRRSQCALVGLMSVLLVVIGLFAARNDWHARLHASFPDSEISITDSPCDGADAPEKSDAGCAIDLYVGGGIHFTQAVTHEEPPLTESFQRYRLTHAGPSVSRSVCVPPGRAPPLIFFS